MNRLLVSTPENMRGLRAKEQAAAGMKTLFLALLLAGIAAGAVWLFRSPPRDGTKPGAPTNAQDPAGLSDSTKAVLQRLDSPLEIRFYSLLDPANVPASLPAFAGRVDQLLSAYVQEANGKLKVTRYDTQSRANEKAALADGIKPFNIDKGDACYLGVALAFKTQKASLAQLSPDWETALESDLTRALARILESSRPVVTQMPGPRSKTAAIEQVKTLIPDPAAVSLEQGSRLIRESGLKDFQTTAKELQTRLKEAQQQFVEAQNGKSEADQQAAAKHLQQIQTEQVEKLKEIAARSQAQVEVFQQLKSASR